MTDKSFRKSIRFKLFFIMISLILLLLTILGIIQISSQRHIFIEELGRRISFIKDSMTKRGKTISNDIYRYTEKAMAAYDFHDLAEILNKTVKEDADLKYAILMDVQGVAHIHTQNENKVEQILTSPEDIYALQQKEFTTIEFKKNNLNYLEFITPIKINGLVWGLLRLGFSLSNIEKEIYFSRMRIEEKLQDILLQTIVITVLFTITGGLIILYIGKRITWPLEQLTKMSSKLASEDFNIEIPASVTNSNDEIGELARTFKWMAQSLKDYYRQLEEHSRTLEYKVELRTGELKKAFEELKKSQSHLIQSEKMASLGQLVAGVAHEINTPIGIGITAASFLNEKVINLKELLKSDEIDENDINPLINHIAESSSLILSNMVRASELIASFKQISADQVSQEKRTFNLKKVISDTLISLKPKLKNTKIHVSVDCSNEIIMDGYPGAISQVITNFVINSIVHAFENNQPGEINIYARKINSENIYLVYKDNGKGIKESFQKKIFDPFATTKRGEGGTGLGLYIVYNIVSKILKGTIKCDSVEGKGIVITINMPSNVKEEFLKR